MQVQLNCMREVFFLQGLLSFYSVRVKESRCAGIFFAKKAKLFSHVQYFRAVFLVLSLLFREGGCSKPH